MADVSTISVLVRARDMASQAFQNIEANAGKMASGFEKHRKTIGIGMTAVGGVITGVGVLSLKAAADVEEMTNMFNVVFKDAAKEVEAWAKTTGDATGTSRFKLMEYAASLQDTFVPMGIARDKAADFSKEMVQLSVDLGSFKNEDPTDVLRRIQSGLVGNTEGMLNYGVVIKAADVNQRILTSGMAAHKDEITEAHRVQMRMTMMLEGTTDAQGDAARSLDSFTGRSRQMKKSLEEAQVTIGQALLPVMTSLLELVTPIITKISEWMQENEGLTKVLVIVGASLGAVMLVLGPMLLILPQLFAGFKLMAAGIRLVTAATAANPVGIILVALTTLAVVVLPLVMKNWDSIWVKIKKVTETVVNFIIGILNKLTIIWRKQFELIAEVVAKLLDMGSKLPFVGDKFSDAADSIRGFSDKLADGIPQIDITTGKQEGLQDTVQDTASKFEDSGDIIRTEQSRVSVSAEDMSIEVSKAYGDVEDGVMQAQGIVVQSLEDIEAKQKEFADKTAYFAKLNKDAEIKAREETRDAFIQTNTEMLESAKATRESVQASWEKFQTDNDPIMQALKDAQMDFGDVMEELAIRHGVSLEEMAAQLQQAQVEHGDLSGLLASRFGEDVDKVLIDSRRMADGVIAEQQRMARERARIQDASLSDLERMIEQSNARILDEAEKARLQQHGLLQVQSALASGNVHIGAGVMDAIEAAADAADAANQGGAGATTAAAAATQRMTNTGMMFHSNLTTAQLEAAGMMANGGIVTSPTLAVIGEAGPEAVIPLSRGSGMGTVNNFHFHGAVYGVEDLKEAVVEAVRDHAISGGFSGVFAEA